VELGGRFTPRGSQDVGTRAPGILVEPAHVARGVPRARPDAAGQLDCVSMTLEQARGLHVHAGDHDPATANSRDATAGSIRAASIPIVVS